MRPFRLIATLLFIAALMAEAIGKPDRVDTGKNGTLKCNWCCPETHRDWGGVVLTHSGCNNTGHNSSCAYRTQVLKR
jgi:hypothetical protein